MQGVFPLPHLEFERTNSISVVISHPLFLVWLQSLMTNSLGDVQESVSNRIVHVVAEYLTLAFEGHGEAMHNVPPFLV